jgi:hypothetical protein
MMKITDPVLNSMNELENGRVWYFCGGDPAYTSWFSKTKPIERKYMMRIIYW